MTFNTAFLRSYPRGQKQRHETGVFSNLLPLVTTGGESFSYLGEARAGRMWTLQCYKGKEQGPRGRKLDLLTWALSFLKTEAMRSICSPRVVRDQTCWGVL